MVARAGNRLPNRPDAGAEACSVGGGANQWHRGDCDLQRWISMGRLLYADDHRASWGLGGFGQPRRRAGGHLSRLLCRPYLVDADCRLHCGSRPRTWRLSKVASINRSARFRIRPIRPGTHLTGRVVIYRGASKFASATFASVYIDRDRPCCLHTDVAAYAGGAELEWRARE